jgi:hypothetical protein
VLNTNPGNQRFIQEFKNMSILQPIIVTPKKKRHVHRVKKTEGGQVLLTNAWTVDQEERFRGMCEEIKITAMTRYNLQHVSVDITALDLMRYGDHTLTNDWWWLSFVGCGDCNNMSEGKPFECKDCTYEGIPDEEKYDFSSERSVRKYVRDRQKWAIPVVEKYWDGLMFSLREVTRRRF